MSEDIARMVRQAYDDETKKVLAEQERLRQERLTTEPELTLEEQMAQEVYAEFDAEDERNRENWKIV